MSVDIEKLEALARAVIAVNELEEVDADEYDQANVQFDELVTPAAMLDLIAEVKQYKAECEALRKDAERLNWLDGQYINIVEGQCLHDPIGELVAHEWSVRGPFGELRDAIDDAMSKQSKQ